MGITIMFKNDMMLGSQCYPGGSGWDGMDKVVRRQVGRMRKPATGSAVQSEDRGYGDQRDHTKLRNQGNKTVLYKSHTRHARRVELGSQAGLGPGPCGTAGVTSNYAMSWVGNMFCSALTSSALHIDP